jgi:spore coat protein U-like protein
MKIGKWARTVGLAASIALMSSGAAFATSLPISATITNTCSIGTVSGLSFTYDPIVTNASTDAHTTGSIDLTCTTGDAAATVGLTLGGQPVSSQRYMKDSGTDTLAYNLYSDTSYSVAWDDSTNKVTAPTGTGSPQTLTVYGSIPKAQNNPAGSYTDTVTIDVTP